jgi:hypothetical protein
MTAVFETKKNLPRRNHWIQHELFSDSKDPVKKSMLTAISAKENMEPHKILGDKNSCTVTTNDSEKKKEGANTIGTDYYQKTNDFDAKITYES